MSGTLYVVATPIGHLDDMTFRAVEILKTVDLVVCEDTRRSGALLRHFDIRKPLMRYDDHTHKTVAPKLIQMLKQGKTQALVTDAGTPGLSDPGNRLVLDAVEQGIVVSPIPGPSAVAAAVSVSGQAKDGFIFQGFLPPRAGRAKRLLQDYFGLGKMVVLYESPFRVVSTLNLICEIEPTMPIILAREMTKVYEEFIRGEAQELRDRLKGTAFKGEFVICAGPLQKKKKNVN